MQARRSSRTPGTVIAIHGSGSAKLSNGSSAFAIKVEQSVTLPKYADQATVFLNGWRLGYLGDDQHVLGLGSIIAKIRMDVDPQTKQNKLVWNALGLLRDNDGEKGYNWSYDFTVLAWSRSSINADVDQGGIQYCTPNDRISDNYYQTRTDYGGETTTALSSFFSFIKNIAFVPDTAVGVLPRGFAFSFIGGSSGIGASFGDRHLLQLAYNLSHSEIFVDARKYNVRDGTTNAPLPSGASGVAASGFVSWKTDAILKDNDTHRDYQFGEVVSALGGRDVGIIQPPYSILPSESTLACGSLASPPIITEELVIRNIPFQYAIPMLTGWDLGFDCSDQHVKEIGVWIDHWSYQPPSGAEGGTLRYTLSSVLRDNDNSPGFAHSHKVSILGLRPVFGRIKGVPAGK